MKIRPFSTSLLTIALSQVTKAFQDTDALSIGAARDSGSVDEASDIVLAIWKDKSEPENNEQKMKLGILKNRRGRTGVVDIIMNRRNLQFRESKVEEPTWKQN